MAIDIVSILIIVDLVARIISFLGFGGAFVFYFFKRDKSSLFNPFLAYAILFGFATFLLYMIDFITWIQFESDTVRRILHGYAYGYLALFLFSWFLHYQAIDDQNSRKYHNLIMIPLSYIWMVIIVFTFKKIVFPIFNLKTEYDLVSDEAFVTLVSHPTWLMGIIVYFFSYKVTKKMVHFSDKVPSKRELLVAKILLFDFILLEFSNFSLTFALIPDALGYLILIIGLLLFEVSFLILIYNGITYPSYQFYLPQAIEGILLYTKTGLLLHSITFTEKSKITEGKGNIMSSVLTALTSLFQEALGYSVEINKINLKGYNVLFLSGEHPPLIMVVISSHDNYFLEKGMKRFFEIMPESLAREFNKRVIELTPSTRDKLNVLIRVSFPFLIHNPEI
jgi:hypothetical protein